MTYRPSIFLTFIHFFIVLWVYTHACVYVCKPLPSCDVVGRGKPQGPILTNHVISEDQAQITKLDPGACAC